jgi:peptidyl-prolyl cis-trans isomerase B (cyclophilin B)
VRRETGLLMALGCALAVAGLATRLSADEKDAKPGVRAMLELNREFYYAGDSLPVRVSVGNEAASAAPNPVKSPLLRGFVVSTAGKTLEPKGTPAVQEPTRPDRLSPKAFYGTVVDLAEIYPELRSPGTYEIAWKADGLEANRLEVRVIPRLDPAKEYQARVETSEGAFTIELFRKAAPLAFKAFTDLANAGYYDGLTLHEVRPELYVAGGDPGASGVTRPPFRFPQEQSTLPVVAGTVLMRPVGAAPPANGPAFMILLRPEPAMNGQATVLGQVTAGLDVLSRISRVPSTEQGGRPFFKPLKDVQIRKISISEKGAAPAPAGS